MKTLRVWYEDAPESPNEWGTWRLSSFNYRHYSFRHPEGLITREGEGATVGIRRKLKAGTAFVLSYFEHGDCVWSLKGEGPQCQFDGVRVAGYLECLVPKYLPKGYAAREAAARAFLETYTKWANGRVYYLKVVDGDEVDELGGVYNLERELEDLVGLDWRTALTPGNALARQLLEG